MDGFSPSVEILLQITVGSGVRRMEMEIRRGGEAQSLLASTSSVSWSSSKISPRTSFLVIFFVGPKASNK